MQISNSAPRRVWLICVAICLAATPSLAIAFQKNDCPAALEAEKRLHADNDAEHAKRVIDVQTAYFKALTRCGNEVSCKNGASKKHDKDLVELKVSDLDENARHSKVLVDIDNKRCVLTRASAPQSSTGDSSGKSYLTDPDRKILYKLSAEMDVMREEFDSGNPATEFGKGLADWGDGIIDFVTHNPAQEISDGAKDIVAYLLNDRNENDRALRAAAVEAIKQFQKNPARFLGKNLPNMITPGKKGVLGEAAALGQIARIKAAVGEIGAIGAVAKDFDNKLNRAVTTLRTLREVKMKGLAKNACWNIAEQRSKNFLKEQESGAARCKIEHPTIIDGKDDFLLHEGPDRVAKMQEYSKDWVPRDAANFPKGAMQQIHEGKPLKMESAQQIKDILYKEGPGAQGIVIAQDRLGSWEDVAHAFNIENDRKGIIRFVDDAVEGTISGLKAVNYDAIYKEWFFLPGPYAKYK